LNSGSVEADLLYVVVGCFTA